ncbi:MAG TPA: dihydrolipoamide acetyltransferase family protein [Fluviicoccus sp.]|nr:dihydrolipoamide acetyltransferase family protein [Fluviicoccus sp.]
MNIFTLPDLGEGLHEAVITDWMARPGDRMERGSTVLAVETAKAVVEIPAPENLTLEKQLATVGEALRVGQPLFSWTAGMAVPAYPTPDAGSVVGRLAAATLDTADRAFSPGSLHFDHAARDLAAQRCRERPLPSPATGASTAGMRVLMQRRLSEAQHSVVPVTLFDEVRLRKPPNPLLPWLVRALCRACREEPVVNAWLVGESLQPREDIHIGIAVDTAYGLVVPVLPYADRLSAAELEKVLADLVLKAREQRLTAADHHDAGITLTSYGALGGRFATPLVVPPQVAILGAGRLRREHRPDKHGRRQTRYLLPLSLSFDHRALTGGEAIRFLNAFMKALKSEAKKKGRP